jgi:hypothetical protein
MMLYEIGIQLLFVVALCSSFSFVVVAIMMNDATRYFVCGAFVVLVVVLYRIMVDQLTNSDG